jgi:hypothetical protein
MQHRTQPVLAGDMLQRLPIFRGHALQPGWRGYPRAGEHIEQQEGD